MEPTRCSSSHHQLCMASIIQSVCALLFSIRVCVCMHTLHSVSSQQHLCLWFIINIEIITMGWPACKPFDLPFVCNGNVPTSQSLFYEHLVCPPVFHWGARFNMLPSSLRGMDEARQVRQVCTQHLALSLHTCTHTHTHILQHCQLEADVRRGRTFTKLGILFVYLNEHNVNKLDFFSC